MKRAEQIRRDVSDAAILAARFPNMSKSTRALNSPPPGPHGIWAGQFIHPDGSKTPIAAVPSPADMPQGRTELTASAPEAPKQASKPKRRLSAPKLNKTEQRWQNAHPFHISFPMSLRWGNCMSYKPDFLDRDSKTIYEIKGAHVFSRDIVRFKGCAAEWSWLFDFQLWQWKDSKWSRLY
jgi:hypothetical protein